MSKNRGRIQAQGGGFEESISWSSENPPTVVDGLSFLDELVELLPYSEKIIREKEIDRARNFIQNSSYKGGIDAPVSKTFKVNGSKNSRIDIEVIKGKAFIPIFLFMIFLGVYTIK
jgi:hypothetical protein